jgi:ribosomal protein S18 acetylase RimI-like enzyme
MNIEKALLKDLKNIHSLTKICGENLAENGIFQWNEQYPSEEILKKDIILKQLWKLTENNKITGIIVLTKIEDKEYKTVKWRTKNNQNLYIHRLAILPSFQKKGYAQKLMDFAEDFAIKNNYKSIRLDTFSKNTRNQQFYKQRNYTKLTSIYFPNQSEFPFYCYEKILNV